MAPTRAGTIRHEIGGILFTRATPKDAAKSIVDLGTADPILPAHVHLANAYTVALANEDKEYGSSLSDEAINFPDGKPIGWSSRIKGHNPPLLQVRGPQFLYDVMEHGIETDVKHFLLGSTPEVLSQLEANLMVRFPDLKIVGTMSPPFRAPTAEELLERDAIITDSGAQIVWVGLGTPKQDHEVKRLSETVPAVSIAIGAAFDFAAGTQAEAPAWMQKIGFEWLFRLMSEPRRLWRRYLFGNIQFIQHVFFRK